MRRAASLIAAVLLCGCEPDARTRIAYALTVPPAWKAIPASAAPLVPGDVLEAYEVPTAAGSGSLIVFRSPHAPETTAAQMLTQTRYLLLNLPSLRLEGTRVATLGGQEAAIVEAVAQGDGRSLAPTGTGKPVAAGGGALLATHRVWVRIPRRAGVGTLELQLHVPAAARDEVRMEWEKVLASMQLH